MTTQFGPGPVPAAAMPNGQPPQPTTGSAAGYLPDGYTSVQRPAVPAPSVPEDHRLPRMRRPRRPALAAGGVSLVVLCGVTSAALATRGDHRVSVITLARDVQAGHVLSGEDLTTAHLGGTGVRALSADGLDNLVGQTVTASLPAGTLLNASMLASAPLPSSGLQLVAVAVKAGGVPEQAVAGRDVSLIRLPSPSTGEVKGAEASVLVDKARLVSISKDDASGLQVLSVEVPQAAALAVAQASGAGTIAVTLLPVTP